MNHRATLIIADDHELLRDALAMHASEGEGFEVVASVGDAQSCVIACADRRPDLLLMDIEMPGRDALAAIADVKASSPGTRVVVLSAFCKEVFVVTSLRHGASGYLLKSEPPAEIFAALGRVLHGETVLSAGVQGFVTLGGVRVRSKRLLVDGLTPRELEVLRSIGRGRDNEAMASEMHVSKRTVERHIERLMNAVNVHSRAGLVKLAYEQELVV